VAIKGHLDDHEAGDSEQDERGGGEGGLQPGGELAGLEFGDDGVATGAATITGPSVDTGWGAGAAAMAGCRISGRVFFGVSLPSTIMIRRLPCSR